jgi:hypothetical protein
MDSPPFNADSPFDCHLNSWFLPEESIFSSQPSLFLQDMEKEMKQNALDSTFLSVIIDEEQSDAVFHQIHSQPDCAVHPFKKDPKLHCETCWCLRCGKPAAKCLSWSIHCKETGKEVKKNMTEKVAQGLVLKKGRVQQTKVKEKNAEKIEKGVMVPHEKNNYLVSKEEKAIIARNLKASDVDCAEKKIMAVKNVKAAEEKEKKIATSKDQRKKYLSSVLKMDEEALNILCKEKGILTKGRATLKHKYAFAPVQEALIQP